MRFTSSLALAFLAIAAQLNSATAIVGHSLKMVANSNAVSSFVASFKDRRGVDDANQELRFDAIFVGNVGDYTDMKCVTELDRESTRSIAVRSFPVGFEEYRHQSDGYVGFKGAIRLGPVDALGDFDLVCTFIPLIKSGSELKSTVYASIAKVEGFVTTLATIHPFSGFLETFEAFIATSRSQTRTTFKLTNPANFAGANGWLRVQSPGAYTATTGSVLVFKSSAPAEYNESYCDAYLDNVLYRKDVTAGVSYNGSYIDLKFPTSIIFFSSIILYCGDVTGRTVEPAYPAILEITFANIKEKRNYAVAKISTDTDDISFDFLTKVGKAFPELFL